MDEGPDEASLMQETYDILMKYPPGMVPLPVLVEVSPMSAKQKSTIKQLMQQASQQPPDQMAEMMKQAKVKQTFADADHKAAQAMHSRSQTVVDQARAAHLASEANLNAAEFAHRAAVPPGIGQPGMPVMPGSPQSPEMQQAAPGGPPDQQGAPASGSASGGPALPSGGQPGAAPQLQQLLSGARKAPDGRHYVPDPRRPGKFLMLA
jgi:hypothetical protein